MNPTLALFIRLTAAIALVIAAFFILGFILKIVLVAGVVAAAVVGILFVLDLFRRRDGVARR